MAFQKGIIETCGIQLFLHFADAGEHAEKALVIGEETGEPSRIKTALFMLGETERSAGNLDAAWEHFSRLQQDFYPESPQITELMLAVGMRKVVHLRA